MSLHHHDYCLSYMRNIPRDSVALPYLHGPHLLYERTQSILQSLLLLGGGGRGLQYPLLSMLYNPTTDHRRS